jgi:predicted nucleic acid-binding protein
MTGFVLDNSVAMRWLLARTYKLSSYDACYLELAVREGLPIATLNKALRKAAKKDDVGLFSQ